MPVPTSTVTVSALWSVCVLLACATHGEQDPAFSEGDAYDRFMGRWSRALAPLLVEFAAVQDGDVVLDVGAGTGALSAAVARMAPSSRIAGIDPSGQYVAMAQQRQGNARVHFETGDAQRMRFEAASFDRTLSLLVVNFIPDARAAVKEMVRVTKTGGVVAGAVWDYGAGMEFLRVFWDEAIALRTGDASRDERHMPFCRSGELSALWRECGLGRVSEEALTIDTAFASFEDYWRPLLGRQGPAGSYVASLPEADREALRARLRRRLLGDGPDRPVTMRARAWAVRGTVE